MIRVVTFVVILLLAGAAGLSWFLIGTAGGALRLVDFGSRWLPGELTVAELEGSLRDGIRAGRVEYRQDDVTVIATDVDLAIDLRQLLAGVVAVDRALAESVTLPDVPIDLRARLSGTLRIAAGLPLAADVEWTDRPSSIRGHGRFTGTLERLDFTHVLELPEEVHVTGVIENVVEAPSVLADVTWDHVTLPGQDFGTLASRGGVAQVEASPERYRIEATTLLIRDEQQQLRARLTANGTPEQLVVESLDLDGLGGELRAEGTVGFGEPPRVLLTVAARGFDPGVLLAGYDGRLDLDAEVDARWPERLTATVTRLEGQFLGSPVSAVGDVLAADGVLQRAEARVRSGANRLRLTVTGQPLLAGEFDIDAPDLASLWPGLAGELRGSGTLSGTLEAPRISVDLSGAKLVLNGQRIEQLSVVGQADEDTGVDFAAGAYGIEVGGQMLGNLTVNGAGTLEAHTLDVNLSGGPVSTRFDVAGSWDGKTLDERVGAAMIDSDIGTWRLREPLALIAGEGNVRISGHCWDREPASICTDGLEFEGDRLVLGAVLTRFPLQAFNRWLGEDIALEGEADATLAFDRDADAFSAVVEWRQKDTRIVFEPAVEEMLAESEIETRLSSVELTLVADETVAELSGSVAGAFGLTAGVEARLENPLEPDGPLSGALRAEVPDIDALRPLVDQYVPTDGLVGALVADVRIGGTRDAPTLDGGARLRDARATIPLFGITVEDIDVTVRAGNDDDLLVDGSARSGDGVIRISGVIAVSPETGLYADLALTGERFQLVRLPDQSAYISPDLTARFDGGQLTLDGRLLVPEAAFEFRELGEAAVATSDDVVVHREDAGPDEPASYSRIAGQVEIELGDAVTFEGLGISTRLGGGLLITLRPGAPPAGEGGFQLVEGTYDAFGREMLIERGSLNFYGPLDDPVIDARATRQFRFEAQQYKIGIEFVGRLSEQLDFVLFSEPAMSEMDVLSFILVGRPAVTGDQEGSMSGAAVALGLQSLGAGRGAGDSLSLDEISFEGGGADDTSVIAGKQLGDKWWIRYEYGIFNRIGTFIIRYDIGRGVSVEAGSGAQQSLDLLYSIDR